MSKPTYVYVASSWRNPLQPSICAALAAAGIDHYDFRNPPGGTGFAWKQVKPAPVDDPPAWCEFCAQPIWLETYSATPGALREPGYLGPEDTRAWRHRGGYAACESMSSFAAPARVRPKGSDWEQVGDYLAMVSHPIATAGFDADFGAMQRADTIVMILPCGKSAHLELGWAVGAGKRTAILLEDPVEPELMYRMVDYIAPTLTDLLAWLGVE